MSKFSQILDDLETLENEQEAAEAEAQEVADSLTGTQLAASGEKVEWLAWGQIQDEILTAFLLCDEEWKGEPLDNLARRLRSSIEEFQSFYQMTDPVVWTQKRMLKLLEAERIRNKAYRWDQVEELALAKIHEMVEKRQVKKLSELLAIAGMANRAERRNGGQNPVAAPNLTQVNLNIGADVLAGGAQLPGPGNLGVMRLSLSDRTLNQLSRGKIIDADAAPLSERIEMLGPDDVPALGVKADGLSK